MLPHMITTWKIKNVNISSISGQYFYFKIPKHFDISPDRITAQLHTQLEHSS